MVDFLDNYGKTQGFIRRKRHKKRKRLRQMNTFKDISTDQRKKMYMRITCLVGVSSLLAAWAFFS